MTRRRCLALGAGAGAALLAGGGHAAEPIDVVVELFSSQGCSSCPPADRLLGELRGRPGVLALTFHVDYWDYLGWKDTLAGPDFSQRQYDYAKARGDMDVFTPQMIVNGKCCEWPRILAQCVGELRHRSGINSSNHPTLPRCVTSSRPSATATRKPPV